VWAGAGGGIYSNKRGLLSSSGINPHLANSGEVVYADWFSGPNWDLVSTKRGRLTSNGSIDINASDFDVNSNGEVVYAIADTSGNLQVHSTVRGLITKDSNNHYNPCINDKGEIIYEEVVSGEGPAIVSTERGTLLLQEGEGAVPMGLNNKGEFCFSGSLQIPGSSPPYYTSPHVFSSQHGAVIDDPNQYQWDGSINDKETIVWGDASGNVYEGNWFPDLSIVNETNGFTLEWTTNSPSLSVEYTTNLFEATSWNQLSGSIVTNKGNFREKIGSPNHAEFFRLCKVLP